MDGVPSLRAQRVSTEVARLCRLTTVCLGGGLRLVSLLKKNWPQPPPFLSKKTGNYLTQILEGVLQGLTDIPEALSVLEFASA